MFLGSHVVVLIIAVFFCSLTITYTLAVTSHHVKPFLPFISYTGNRPLESCIFSFAISICSALLIIIVFLRYIQLCDVIEKLENDERFLRKMTKLNFSSMVLGVLGGFGLTLTASFQQINFVLAHFVGVFFCIYVTFVYFVTQTHFTFKLPSELTKRIVKVIRLSSVIGSALILVGCSASILYDHIKNPRKMKFTSSYQREEDVSGALLEWILLVLYLFFIATFYPDLKKVSLTSDQIILLE